MTENAVDTHFHVFSADAPAVPGARYRPAYAATWDDWRTHANECAVTHGVVVQPSFLGTDNTELMALLANDRSLRGVAVIDVDTDDEEIERLHAGGVRGIRLNLAGASNFDVYAGEAWRRLLRRLHNRAWHLELHHDAGLAPKALMIARDLPITIVLDHFGKPDIVKGVDCETFAAAAALADARAVYVKFSAAYRLGGLDAPTLAKRWLECLGPAAILWGSDWPWTNFEGRHTYAACRAMLDDCVPDIAMRRQILWTNPARLFGF